MSAVINDLRLTAERRLRELEEQAREIEAESEHLRGVLRALDTPTEPAGPAPRKRPTQRAARKATTPARAKKARGRAPQGANKRRILETVAENPGISAAAVARAIDRPRTVIASTMTRMKSREGLLEPHGEGVRLTDSGRAELARQLDGAPASP